VSGKFRALEMTVGVVVEGDDLEEGEDVVGETGFDFVG
jgi:hypothetical protein